MRKAALVAALITVFSVPAAPALAVGGTGTAAARPVVTALRTTDAQPVPVAIFQPMTTITVHVRMDRAHDCVRLFSPTPPPRYLVAWGCSATRDVTVTGTVPSARLTPGKATWTLMESNRRTAPLQVKVFQRAYLTLSMPIAGRHVYVVGGSSTYYDRFRGQQRPYLGAIHLQELIAGKWVTVRTVQTNQQGLFRARMNHDPGLVTIRATRPEQLPMGGASSAPVRLFVR